MTLENVDLYELRCLSDLLKKYDIKIKGALDSYYKIDTINVDSDGKVLFVSHELESELENALGEDL